MLGRNAVPDKSLLQSVLQRLARTGTGGQSRVTVTVQQGVVTLSGTLNHAIQRDPILKAAAQVAGVRSVTDQMRLLPKPTH
jgi:osmotically-inducible protein OsmY